MRDPSDSRPLVEGDAMPATSGVEESAMRLLGAFYDLSEGKLTEPVPLGGPQTPGAAPKADLDPGSPECDIAVRYLVDQKLIAPRGDAAQGSASEYLITVPCFDRVREVRGLGGPTPPAGSNKLSDKT